MCFITHTAAIFHRDEGIDAKMPMYRNFSILSSSHRLPSRRSSVTLPHLTFPNTKHCACGTTHVAFSTAASIEGNFQEQLARDMIDQCRPHYV